MGKTGIVILNYMTWQETNNCIASVQKCKGISKFRIYVVDNASPNFQEAEKLVLGENIQFIANEKNTGYAAGNNVGIRKAWEDGCDYILITNNDVLFEPDSILKMQKYLEQHKEYGIVAPCILDKDKRVTKCHFMKKVEYRDIWVTQTIIRYLHKKGTSKVYGDYEIYQNEQDIFASMALYTG